MEWLLSDQSAGRGRFITFEGGEGAGKSTQIKRLASTLQLQGLDVVATREPGGTDGAEAIRALVVQGTADRWDPLTELFLIMAARQDHVQRLILPALQQGQWVISDRFFDSSRVYQGIAGGLGLDLIDRFHEPVLPDAMPDLTVVIDLDPEIGLARAARQGHEERFEAKGLSFHQQVRDGFLALADRDRARFLVIDGNQSADAVSAAIYDGVKARLDSN